MWTVTFVKVSRKYAAPPGSSRLPGSSVECIRERQTVPESNRHIFGSAWLLPMAALMIAAALPWLAGCARFEPRPLSASENASRLENRTLTNTSLRAFLGETLERSFDEWPAASWDLDMLTMAGLYYQPALELARAQLAVAAGGKITAAQRPNPTLNVTPGYNFTTLTPSPWLPLGSLDVHLETAGKRRYRKEQATHLTRAAQFHVLEAAWQVRSETRTALLDLKSAEARANMLRAQLNLRQQLLERLEQQVRAGAVARSETLNFRLALTKAQLDEADSARQQIDARARLAAAIAVPAKALEQVSLKYDLAIDEKRLAQLSSSEVRLLALTSRADILASVAEYAASESALRLEIAKQYPDLRLAPGYEYDQGDSKWSLGLTLDLPLLNQNQGPIAEAGARRAEAASRFNVLQAKVLSEIDRAVEGLKIAGK